ncbi:hypothetical protein HNR60_002141 [Rhodopseudomonas rhenobacensis]|uniref:Uncharacterized protein n=1 Tax=Rhodopseudomonas rhenobacensis TaxID=87461 RepID=A0A7W7Z3M8_9BRAD|nr:preprotein translocase subunit YajC [Rhodopseudomonas rhenobacensis]MBB5047386.1 hypothetical protein [Rhodopseudomonas rhenobacensis]
MTTKIKVTDEMLAKAMAAYRGSGGTDDACLRAALEAALSQETFSVGDQVTCVHGSVTGIILSIVGDEALISWSCRGKSTAKLATLDHADELRVQPAA